MTVLLESPAPADIASPPSRPRPLPRQFGTLLTASAPAVIITGWLAARAVRPMTMDESFTVLTSTRSWWSLARGCTTDPGMAVYYTLLKSWTVIAGDGLGQLRLLSTIAVALAAVGIAALSVARRRPMFGMLASVGAVLSPMAREAAVDARAAALGLALAVWLAVLCDRWLRSTTWNRGRVVTILAASVALAFVHPSTLFAGFAGAVLVWRRSRRLGSRSETHLALGATGVVVLGGLAAAMQSGAADSVARPGLMGIGQVLGQLPGGRILAGAALVATALVLLAGRSFDDERILRWFGGASLLWFAACLFALPVRSLFVPRYFLAAGVLVLATVTVAKLEHWSAPLIWLTLALTVVGGAAQLGTGVAGGSTWCRLSDRLAGAVHPGDTVAFATTTYQSPVLACLGDRAGASVLRGTTVVPTMPGRTAEDPRALWLDRPARLDAVTVLDRGASTHLIWVTGIDIDYPHVVEQLKIFGAHCTTTQFGDLSLASCASPS